ncbi:MAG: endonuclease III [Candidatus Woesearchaeota archaeon]
MVSHAEIDIVLKRLLQSRGRPTMLNRLGRKYDAYKVLISTILSARAKDEVTEVIAADLFKKYPTAERLAKAKRKDVVRIIRRIGFYNNKSKNVINAAKMIVDKFGGRVPQTIPELLEIPGVGRKVANCVLVYAFGMPALPVDTHVHRVTNRLGWVKTKTPEETEFALEKIVPRKHWLVVNEAFVSHGKSICVPVSPFCSKCPIIKYCRRISVTKSR